jgi:CheY-like chemotaxis protein
MKILVIEDKKMHREAAEQTLEGHEVTIVGSFDKAMELMRVEIDKDKVGQLLREAGFAEMPTREKDGDDYSARNQAYWEAKDKAEDLSAIPFSFEVVLTDMMMPMSQKTLATGVFKWDEQVPYGFIIALRAALVGAKFVAMVTDTNHHQGAMSAAIDHLGTAYYCSGFRSNFIINGARVSFVHSPFIKETVGKRACFSCEGSGECRPCGGTGTRNAEPCSRCEDSSGKCYNCKGTKEENDVRHERKDWGLVLRDLIAD